MMQYLYNHPVLSAMAAFPVLCAVLFTGLVVWAAMQPSGCDEDHFY